MTSNDSWRGVFPALTTQFTDDGTTQTQATIDHLDQLIDEGIDGVVVLGTVGENASLRVDEKLDLLQCIVGSVKGRIPVLTGVAENTTTMAIDYARESRRMGADGLMVLPAMLYKSDPRETLAHFRGVAAATDLPVMCYNNPVTYGVDITPEMFEELADVDTLVAIKESSDDPRRITDLTNRLGDRYTLFGGVDDLVLESVLLGATGTVSGLVNAFPKRTIKMWNLATAGKWEAAREIYRWFMPLLHLDTHPKLVQYIKLVMQECGMGREHVRTPRLPLVGEEREHVIGLARTALAALP